MDLRTGVLVRLAAALLATTTVACVPVPRVPLALEPPSAVQAAPPTEHTVVVEPFEDLRRQPELLLTLHGDWVFLTDADVPDQIARQVTEVLGMAGIRGVRHPASGSCSLRGKLVAFHATQTQLPDGAYRLDAKVSIWLTLSALDETPRSISLEGSSFREWEGNANLQMLAGLLNDAAQDAVARLPRDPTFREFLVSTDPR